MTEANKTVWTNHYLCPCGEEWQGQHDSCCNDRCPNCRREIEPFISDDGSVAKEQIEAALEATLVRLELCRCDDCGKIWNESDLQPVLHPAKRIDVGGPIPSGECPECGALAYQVKEKEQLFIVLHQHEFGTSGYLALAPREPTLEESIKAFEIDFEPEKQEFLEIVVPGQPVRIEVAR